MADNFIEFIFKNVSEVANIKERNERLWKKLEALAQREEAICQQEVQRKEVEREAKRQYVEQLKCEEEKKQRLLRKVEEWQKSEEQKRKRDEEKRGKLKKQKL